MRIVMALMVVVLLAGCSYWGRNLAKRAQIGISGYPPNVCLIANYEEEMFKPSYAVISTMTPEGERTIWAHEFPDADTEPVGPKQCMPLRTDNLIEMLQPRVAYHIVLRNQVGLSRFFTGEFCIVGKPGNYEVLQVNYQKKLGRRDWSPCNLILTPPQ